MGGVKTSGEPVGKELRAIAKDVARGPGATPEMVGLAAATVGAFRDKCGPDGSKVSRADFLDIYLRAKSIFPTITIISGASVALIHPQRQMNDVDTVVRDTELVLTPEMSAKIYAAGFVPHEVHDGVLHAIVDKTTGVRIDTNNTATVHDGVERIISNEQTCVLLGCTPLKESALGLSKKRIVTESMTLPISHNDTTVDVRVPRPLHQVAIKYNLWRLRHEPKDVRDLQTIVRHYYESPERFFAQEEQSIAALHPYLGADFETHLSGILASG